MTTQSGPRPSVASTEASRAIAADPEIAGLGESERLEGIERLRREREAVILAHNYQSCGWESATSTRGSGRRTSGR